MAEPAVTQEMYTSLLKMADECVLGFLGNIDPMELSDEVVDIINDREGRFDEKGAVLLVEWFKKQLNP